MKKYPIENFYIGKLNILFPPTNLLAAACGAPPTKEEVDVLNLVSNTAWNGAFHIDDSYGGTTRLSNGFRVASLLALFYKNGEDEYYCLHNGNTYSTNDQKSHCTELRSLTSCLPKFAFYIHDKISVHQALEYSKMLLKDYKRPIYNKEKFDLNKFYYGFLDLCTSYEEEDEPDTRKSINILEKRIMYKRPELSLQCGYGECVKIDGIDYVADYIEFRTVYLKIDDTNYYNINNYHIYNIDCMEPFCDKVCLDVPLRFKTPFESLPDLVTIPMILQKQKML